MDERTMDEIEAAIEDAIDDSIDETFDAETVERELNERR
jgi:hypothetical protein